MRRARAVPRTPAPAKLRQCAAPGHRVNHQRARMRPQGTKHRVCDRRVEGGDRELARRWCRLRRGGGDEVAASCRVLSRQRPAHTLSWWTRTSTFSWNSSRHAPRRPEPAVRPRATRRLASSLLNEWHPPRWARTWKASSSSGALCDGENALHSGASRTSASPPSWHARSCMNASAWSRSSSTGSVSRSTKASSRCTRRSLRAARTMS